MDASWTITFVLGAPGAGKGTQCARIVEQYGWKHLSTGDLLRAEVAAETELGLEAKALMEAGEMVPTSLVLDLLVNAMAASGATRFLVDGFPRKLDQLEEFEAKIQPADFVLVFTLPEEEAVARLVKRGETSGRADDNEDTIRSRMQVFSQESQPVIDSLKSTGRVAEIDSQGSVDDVFQLLAPVMESLQEKAADKEASAGAGSQEAGAEPDANLPEPSEQPAAESAAPEGDNAEPAEETAAIEEQAGDGEPVEAAAEAEEAQGSTEEPAQEQESTEDAAGVTEVEQAQADAAAEVEAPVEEAAPAADEAPAAVAPAVELSPDSKVVFVLGAPGAGKGTQCARIVEEFGWKHLSTGDLLRAEVAAGTPLGQEAASIMEQGGFVPTSLICDLLVGSMAASGATRFLVDGFPRKLDQLQEFEAKVRPADFVLVFTLPEEEAVARLVKRGETSGRADDNEDTIRSRMQVFSQESQPVIDSLKSTGRVAEIDSQGSVDDVYTAVKRVIAGIEGQEVPPAEAQEQEPVAEVEAPVEEAAPETDEAPAAVAPAVELSPDSKVVFVLGAPGAGKGTQCARIVEEFGWKHLSTGDLLRAEVAAGTPLGQEAASIMEQGGFVPTSLICDLLVGSMAASGATRFLVDGFPRKLDQLQEFEAKVRPADFVLVFTLPEEEAVARLVKRGETSGRADDNEDTIRSRMQVFSQESQPVIDSLKSTGRVAEIDSQGSVDDVYTAVKQVIAGIEGQEVPPAEAQEQEPVAEVEAPVEEAAPAADEAPAAVAPAVELSPDSKVVFVLGAPGAGKGTQCARIVEEFGWKHLSTGDLLRAEVAAGTPLGQEAASIMEQGGFVPTSLICDLLVGSMAASGATRFLVDGFPRKLDQLQEFEAKVRPADFVLVFTLPEEEAVARLVKRGETSGRADDNEDTIRSRMQVFSQESQPVIDSLKSTGRVAEIDSQGSVDDVYTAVKQVIAGIEGQEVPPAEAQEQEPVAEVEAPVEEAAPAADEAPTAVAPAVELSPDSKVVFVLGAPGAGKGTQCARIVEEFGWKHLSTGDLLRAEVAAGTPLGQEAASIMEQGGFVPTSLICDLLVGSMVASGATRFLVDGFPRKLDQLQEFEAKVRPADFVLVFTLPEEEAVARLVKRGETSGRADDNEDTIRSRMQVFSQESQPVIDSLKSTGRVAEIDSQGSVDDVYTAVKRVIAGIEGHPVEQRSPSRPTSSKSERQVESTAPESVDELKEAFAEVPSAEAPQDTPEAAEYDAAPQEPLAEPLAEPVAEPLTDRPRSQEQPAVRQSRPVSVEAPRSAVDHNLGQKPPTPPAQPPPALAGPPRSPLVASRTTTAPTANKDTGAGVRGLPVRQYMDTAVVPVLREALRALNDARPEDPLQFLSDQLLAARARLSNLNA